MADEAYPIPNWIVMGIGTGGTVATLGQYIQYKGHFSRLCAVDVEHAAYFDSFVRSEARRHLDTLGMGLIARMHGSRWYARCSDLFQLDRVSYSQWKR